MLVAGAPTVGPESGAEPLNAFWAVPWPAFEPVHLLKVHDFTPRPLPQREFSTAEAADVLAEQSPYGERFVDPKAPEPASARIARRLDKLKLDLGLTKPPKGVWLRSSKLRRKMATDVPIAGVLDHAQLPRGRVGEYGDADIAEWQAEAREMRRLAAEGEDPSAVFWKPKPAAEQEEAARDIHRRALAEMAELARFKRGGALEEEEPPKPQPKPVPRQRQKDNQDQHPTARLARLIQRIEAEPELPNETAPLLSVEMRDQLDTKFEENLGKDVWTDVVGSRAARPLDTESAFLAPALQLQNPDTTIRFGAETEPGEQRAETNIYTYVDVDKSAAMKQARWMAGIAESHLALNHPDKAFDCFSKAAKLFLSETSAADDRDPDSVFPYSRDAHEAAAAIQRAVRRRRATLERLSSKLAWVWRGFLVRRVARAERRRLGIAARCIQRLYARRHWLRSLAALAVQRRQRGILGRIRAYNTRMTPPAIRVQYWWRCRRAVWELFRRKVFVVKKKLAVRTLQRFKHYIKFRLFEVEVEKVQRAYRAHLWRRWRDWAATKIQGGWKVFKTLQKYRDAVLAARALERDRRADEDAEVEALLPFVELWAHMWVAEHPNGQQELANEIRRQKLKRRGQAAGRLSKEQRVYREALDAFQMFDEDGSGELDAGEMQLLLRELCLPADDKAVAAIMLVLDEDGSGDVDFDEFFTWYTNEDHDDPTMAMARLQLKARRALLRLTGDDLLQRARAQLLKDTLQRGQRLVRRAFRLYKGPRFACPQCDEPFAVFSELREHMPKGRCPVAGVSAAAAAYTMTADQLAHEEVLLREEEEQQEIDYALERLERDMQAFLSTPSGASQLSSLARSLRREYRRQERAIDKELEAGSDEQRSARLRLVFDVFDSTRSGSLSRAEFKELLYFLRIPVSESRLDSVMTLVDSDGNGEVVFQEFLGWFVYEADFTRARTGRWARLRNNARQTRKMLSGEFFTDEARRVLMARATHDARVWARDEFRKKFPPKLFCDECLESFADEDALFEHFLNDDEIHAARAEAEERLFARSKLPSEARQHAAKNGLTLSVAEHRLALLIEDANFQAGEEAVAFLETEEGKAQLEAEAEEIRVMQTSRKNQLSGMGNEERERAELLEMFGLFDVDGSGSIDREELRELARELSLGVSEKAVGPLMLKMDTDGSGQISFEEFLQWWREERGGRRGCLGTFSLLRRRAGSLLKDTAVLKARKLIINRRRLEARTRVKEQLAAISSLRDASTNLARVARLAAAEAEANLQCDTFLRSAQGKGELEVEVGNLRAKMTQRAKLRADEAESHADRRARDLRMAFDLFDADGSGEISVDELRHLIAALGLSVARADIEHLVHVMDADGSGNIDFDEFRRWYLLERRKKESRSAKAKAALMSAKGMLEITLRHQARQMILTRYRTQCRVQAKLEDEDSTSVAAKGHLAEHDDEWWQLPLSGDPDRKEANLVMEFSERKALEDVEERMNTEDGRYDFNVEVERLNAARAVKERMQRKMTDEERRREDVQYVFDLFDVDNSGAIDTYELLELLKQLGMHVPKGRLGTLLMEMDDDESGTIDFDEFYAWYTAEQRRRGGLLGRLGLRRGVGRRGLFAGVQAAIKAEARRALLSRARAGARFIARNGHQGMKARRRGLEVFAASGSVLPKPARVATSRDDEAGDSESAEARRARLHVAHAERDAELACKAFLDTPEGRAKLQREVVRLEQREMDARRREEHLPAEERRRAQVRRVFDAFDADGSGEIDLQELDILLEELNVPLKRGDLNRIMAEMDEDGSGDVDFDEFYAWYAHKLDSAGFLSKVARVQLQLGNVMSNTLVRLARLEMTAKARKRARYIAKAQIDAMHRAADHGVPGAGVGDPSSWFLPAAAEPTSAAEEDDAERPGSSRSARLRPLSARPASAQSLAQQSSGGGSGSRPGSRGAWVRPESARSRPWSHRSDELSLFGGSGSSVADHELGQLMERALATKEAHRAADLYVQTEAGQAELLAETARLRELRVGLEFKGYGAGELDRQVVRYHFTIFEVGQLALIDADDLPDLMHDLGRPIPELEVLATQRQLRDEFNMVSFEAFYDWYTAFRPPPPASRIKRATMVLSRGLRGRTTVPQDAARLIRNRFVQEAREQIAVNYAAPDMLLRAGSAGSAGSGGRVGSAGSGGRGGGSAGRRAAGLVGAAIEASLLAASRPPSAPVDPVEEEPEPEPEPEPTEETPLLGGSGSSDEGGADEERERERRRRRKHKKHKKKKGRRRRKRDASSDTSDTSGASGASDASESETGAGAGSGEEGAEERAPPTPVVEEPGAELESEETETDGGKKSNKKDKKGKKDKKRKKRKDKKRKKKKQEQEEEEKGEEDEQEEVRVYRHHRRPIGTFSHPQSRARRGRRTKIQIVPTG